MTSWIAVVVSRSFDSAVSPFGLVILRCFAVILPPPFFVDQIPDHSRQRVTATVGKNSQPVPIRFGKRDVQGGRKRSHSASRAHYFSDLELFR
ncbi:hypothetical protein [Actinoplanes couchii]|uniref:hypothetical protein n=1 Tax=Actinoplanes couchii TaxID=403638 RepID=UPI001940C414|nr:hypothetical protein [Actinoplanes couchii]MDR6316294.1 hypothetical protein [Actinoplanes couchii]